MECLKMRVVIGLSLIAAICRSTAAAPPPLISGHLYHQHKRNAAEPEVDLSTGLAASFGGFGPPETLTDFVYGSGFPTNVAGFGFDDVTGGFNTPGALLHLSNPYATTAFSTGFGSIGFPFSDSTLNHLQFKTTSASGPQPPSHSVMMYNPIVANAGDHHPRIPGLPTTEPAQSTAQSAVLLQQTKPNDQRVLVESLNAGSAAPLQPSYSTATFVPQQQSYSATAFVPQQQSYPATGSKPQQHTYSAAASVSQQQSSPLSGSAPQQQSYVTVISAPLQQSYPAITSDPLQQSYPAVGSVLQQQSYTAVGSVPQQQSYSAAAFVPQQQSSPISGSAPQQQSYVAVTSTPPQQSYPAVGSVLQQQSYTAVGSVPQQQSYVAVTSAPPQQSYPAVGSVLQQQSYTAVGSVPQQQSYSTAAIVPQQQSYSTAAIVPQQQSSPIFGSAPNQQSYVAVTSAPPLQSYPAVGSVPQQQSYMAAISAPLQQMYVAATSAPPQQSYPGTAEKFRVPAYQPSTASSPAGGTPQPSTVAFAPEVGSVPDLVLELRPPPYSTPSPTVENLQNINISSAPSSFYPTVTSNNNNNHLRNDFGLSSAPGTYGPSQVSNGGPLPENSNNFFATGSNAATAQTTLNAFYKVPIPASGGSNKASGYVPSYYSIPSISYSLTSTSSRGIVDSTSPHPTAPVSSITGTGRGVSAENPAGGPSLYRDANFIISGIPYTSSNSISASSYTDSNSIHSSSYTMPGSPNSYNDYKLRTDNFNGDSNSISLNSKRESTAVDSSYKPPLRIQ